LAREPVEWGDCPCKPVRSRHTLPFMFVLQVNVPSRQARFQAFAATLPFDVRGYIACMHGTPKSGNAFSIARNGPDFSIVTNGRVYGQGFYCADSFRTPRSYVDCAVRRRYHTPYVERT
jgi:hypothetical protein